MEIKKSEKVVCNYCKGKVTRILYFSQPFSIVQCIACELGYLSPRPSQKEIITIYNDDYFGKDKVGSGYSDYRCLENDLGKESIRRLKLIRQFVQDGKLLDAGCGFGDFLDQAQQEGFSVTGCDISKEAIEMVKEKYKLTAYRADIVPGKMPKGPFDVITSWDVIEHMTDPLMSLKALFKSTKNDGYLFMTTPDIESIDAKILGKYWYGFKRIPEHLYYFSPKTMKRYLEKVGFETISIRPWGFQRNLAYCIDQIGRYSGPLQRLSAPFSKLFNLDKVSLFFPFIDMMVIAKKPK